MSTSKTKKRRGDIEWPVFAVMVMVFFLLPLLACCLVCGDIRNRESSAI